MTRCEEFGAEPHLPPTERWFEVLERGAAAEVVAEHAAMCETHWRSAVPQRQWSGGFRALRRSAASRVQTDTRGS